MTMRVEKTMSKKAFLCDMEAIEDDFDSVCSRGAGMLTIQGICVAIFRLLALYIHYKVGYLDKD